MMRHSLLILTFIMLTAGLPHSYAAESTLKINLKPQANVTVARGQILLDDMIAGVREIYRDHPDPRQGGYYTSWPAERQITVTSPSGHQVTGTIRMVSVHWVMRKARDEPFLYDNLIDTFKPEGGCTYQSHRSWRGLAIVIYKIPLQSQRAGGYCSASKWHPIDLGVTKARFNFTRGAISGGEITGFTYEIIFPATTAFESGDYLGAASYSLGEFADFDFGPTSYAANNIKINVKVSVSHQLSLVFPPDGTVMLKPADNWHGYHSGKRPLREASGSIPFTFSSSAQVKFSFLCPNTWCRLEHDTDSQFIPYNASITIPGATISQNGQPVIDIPFNLEKIQYPTEAIYITPGRGGTVTGSINFDLKRPNTLRAGSYRGSLTLLAEAVVD